MSNEFITLFSYFCWLKSQTMETTKTKIYILILKSDSDGQFMLIKAGSLNEHLPQQNHGIEALFRRWT
jgi:hypothetical protein